MDISRAIDRIRKIKNQEETENKLGGKPPEFNKWGEKPDGGKKQNNK